MSTDASAQGDWFTHPSFDDSTTEISFTTASGPIRCPVVERVFFAPENVRLHSSFRRAAPPAEAREMLRRQKIAELKEQAAKLGLSVADLFPGAADPEDGSAEATSAPVEAPVAPATLAVQPSSPRRPAASGRRPGSKRGGKR